MNTIVIRMADLCGREGATREPISPSRPSVSGTTHLFSKRGGRNSSRNSAGYQPLRMRAGGIDNPHPRAGCIDAILQSLSALNSSRPIRLPGSLIPGLRRALQLFQEPAHRLADRLQVSILSAASSGLGLTVYGQHSGTRKSENVRQSGEKIHV